MIEIFGQPFDLENPGSAYFHGDCMEGMKAFPDKWFDLAVVDPPYGNKGGKCTGSIRFHAPMFDKFYEPGKKTIGWDHAPNDDYFDELFRISKEQIIWGGNYFQLPPNRCFLVWRKTNVPEKFTLAMVEYAWCSFNQNAKLFAYPAAGQKGRFHITQKPVELYHWIFGLYAKRGMKILDTHVGSASSLIAAHDAGLTYVGFELDDYYYEKSKARLDAHTAQLNIFDFIPREED